jgi:uncharacterized protein YfiM (DUF2279 family)
MHRHAWSLSGALFLLATGARAQTDSWWSRDKALHFTAASVIAGGGYAASSLVLDERWQRFGAGFGLAMAAGVAKEVYDLNGHGTASYKDLAWDVAGAAVGASVALLVDHMVSGPAEKESRPLAAPGPVAVFRW